MSYYQFMGPVQGALGFGPADEEMRRRRKHHAGAWRPYEGGMSVRPSEKFNRVPQYQDQVVPSSSPTSQPQGAAPRMQAAVDMGQGPVQLPVQQAAAQQKPGMDLSYEQIMGRPYDPSRMIGRSPSPSPEPEPMIAAGAGQPPRRGKDDDDQKQPPDGVPQRPRPEAEAPPVVRPPAQLPQIQRPAAPRTQEPDLFEDNIGTAAAVQVPVPARVAPDPQPVRVSRPTTKRRRGAGAGPPGFGPVRRRDGRQPSRDTGVPTGGGGGEQPPKRPGDEPYSGPPKTPRKSKISWGKDQVKRFEGDRFTPGSVLPWVPGERERNIGYQQLGKQQGREIARREHQIELEKLQKKNRGLMNNMYMKLGGAYQQQDRLHAEGLDLARRANLMEKQKDQQIKQLQQGMGREGLAKQRAQAKAQQLQRMGSDLEQRAGMQVRQLQEGMGRQGLELQRMRDQAAGQLQREQDMRGRYEGIIGAGKKKIAQLQAMGSDLEKRAGAQVRQLQEGMGREGLARQRAEQRANRLQAMGQDLETRALKQIKELRQGMGREGLARQRAETAYRKLLDDSNRNVQELEKKIADGSADREAAQKEIDQLSKQLDEMRKVPKAPAQDKSEINAIKGELAGLKAALRGMPKQAAAAPIVVQGGAGGGGASSSAGGSSSSAGSGGGGAAPRAPDLSGVVEAVKKIAETKSAGEKKAGGAKSTKGITQARRSYTDKRKVKLAELRSLKAKRIREFNAKTKKMPKEQRDKARREFKKKVNAQFKEMQGRFPTARGLKSVGVIRDLIRKIDAIKTAK